MEGKYDARHIARYFDQLAEGEWRRLEADGPARVSFHVHLGACAQPGALDAGTHIIAVLRRV